MILYAERDSVHIIIAGYQFDAVLILFGIVLQSWRKKEKKFREIASLTQWKQLKRESKNHQLLL